MKQLPDWVYRGLPFFYLCVGLLTMIVLQSTVAVFSGLVLISAGVIVWLLRRKNRRESQKDEGNASHRERPSSGRGQKASDRGLVEISWNKSFECGHHVIDAQHRRLFGIGNELIDAVLSKKPKYDVEMLLDELVDHIDEHFATEEALLAKTSHPISDEHRDMHHSLLASARSLRDRYHKGEIIINELVGFITYDVVTKHIIEEDRKFATEASS